MAAQRPPSVRTAAQMVVGPRLRLLPPPASRFPHRCRPEQGTGPWRRTVHSFELAWALAEAGNWLRFASASFSHLLSISPCLIVADLEPSLPPLSDCCTYSLCIKARNLSSHSPFLFLITQWARPAASSSGSLLFYSHN